MSLLSGIGIKLRAPIFLVVLFCIAQTKLLNAQKNIEYIDSLKQELKKSETDIHRFMLNNDLCAAFGMQDPATAIRYGKAAFALTDKIPLEYLEIVVTLYMNAGMACYYQGNPEDALANYLEGIKLGEGLAEKLPVARILNNMGLLHYAEGRYQEAYNNHMEAYKIIKHYEDYHSTVSVLTNLGNVLYYLKRTDEMREHFLLAAKAANKSKNELMIARCASTMGFVYITAKEYDKARESYKKSISVSEKLGDHIGIMYGNMNLGHAEFMLGDTVQAEQCYIKCLKHALETNNAEMIAMGYQYIGLFYGSCLNYEKAYGFTAKYMSFKDSVQVVDRDKMMTEMQTKYETEKKQNEIEALRKDQMMKEIKLMHAATLAEKKEKELAMVNQEKEIQRMALEHETMEREKRDKELLIAKKDQELIRSSLEIEKMDSQEQRTQRNAMMGGVLLLLILSGVVFLGYQRKKKSNKQLTQQNTQILEQRDLIEEKSKEITDSINYALRIQKAIFPPAKLIKKCLPESYILFKPKDIVAGDFYWLEEIGDWVIFAAADCTGHGVPGAMVSVVCNNALNRSVREFELRQPAQILDKVRDLVIETFEKSEEEVKDGMDIALCALNSKTRELHFTGANNPLYIIKELDEHVTEKSARTDTHYIKEIKADKQPIGKYAEAKPFTHNIEMLTKGDIIIIFSDGYADQFGGPKGKKLKYKPFKKLLLSIRDKPMEEQHDVIDELFEEWRSGLEQVDDVCIIGVKV